MARTFLMTKRETEANDMLSTACGGVRDDNKK